MKKIIFIITLVLILALSSIVAFAQDSITVTIDSNKVEFNSEIGTPFIDQNYRTQVPFRATLEKFGAEVDWNNQTQVAIATKDDITVEVPIGQNYILKNGEKIDTDTAAIVESNRTYLPIRAVIEAFGSEVQWDKELSTVVITSTPIDAKEILMDTYTKSANWKSYDGNIVMDMTIPVPDENGDIQSMALKTNMNITAFTNPQKIKLTSDMVMDFDDQTISQSVMDVYITTDNDNFVTYTGIYGENGELNWSKSTIEDTLISELTSYNIKSSLEMMEKYIKDVKYFGKYTDENRKSLLRIQNTLSGEIYTELLAAYIEELSSSASTSDILTAETLKTLGDFEFILYIDEDTGELVKYELDLSSIYSSIFSGIANNENLSPDDKATLSILKDINSKIIINIISINQSNDFEVPTEALEAIESSDTSVDSEVE
jgi:hypothetical protein